MPDILAINRTCAMTDDHRSNRDAQAPGALQSISRAIAKMSPAPVDKWNPPYCGDIGLEIRADGAWYYRGTPISRRTLVQLFASVLRKDEDGQTFLVTPAEKILVRVTDAAFVAVEMSLSGEGRSQTVSFRTSLDEWLTVSAANPLRFELQPQTGGLKPYVRVRGRLEALVCRSVYLELVELAQIDTGQDSEMGVWSGGIWWPFGASGSATMA
jgi:uncharacterized protein